MHSHRVFPAPSIPSLAQGTIVADLRVVRCLGAEPGWIYYAAEREGDRLPVVMQEIFPLGSASREGTLVCPHATRQQPCQEMLQTARHTGALLAKVNHRHVWKLRRTLEANATLYFIFDWMDGPNLAQRLRLLGRPATPVEAGILLDQVLSAAEALHAAGLVHGSLEPERILMRRGEEPVIGGFKWFRQGSGGVTAAPSGYASLEAGTLTNHLSASCDVYSLAAVIYTAITGQIPPAPQVRQLPASDPCPAVLHRLQGTFPPRFLSALTAAFQPRAADRLPDIAAWRQSLAAPSGSAAVANGQTSPANRPPPPLTAQKRSRSVWGRLALAGLLGLAGWQSWKYFSQPAVPPAAHPPLPTTSQVQAPPAGAMPESGPSIP